MEKLLLLIVEAAVELAPRETWSHPAVKSYAAKRGKKPGEVLLDKSYHYAAMKGLPKSHKRGRPDIAHFTLLEALGSPLNRHGLLQVYLHTQDGHIIYINPETRLPRVYERFKGLLEKLYREPAVEADGKTLLKLESKSLRQLLEELKPDVIILFSEKGERLGLKALAETLKTYRRPVAMVGGFPHGDFEEDTRKLADLEVSLYPEPLEAWTIVSRILCAAEWSVID